MVLGIVPSICESGSFNSCSDKTLSDLDYVDGVTITTEDPRKLQDLIRLNSDVSKLERERVCVCELSLRDWVISKPNFHFARKEKSVIVKLNYLGRCISLGSYGVT